MRLKLATPALIVVDEVVTQVTAEGTHGSFCLLPRHIDFLAVLVPGLLSWLDESGAEHFAAVGEGVLVKQGDLVLISAAEATSGTDLQQLRATVHDVFLKLDDRQRAAHAATAKLEANFIRSYMDYREEAS